MWSISVEPIPSTIVDAEAPPASAEHGGGQRLGRRHADADRLEKSPSAAPGARTIAPYSAGTEKNTVGRSRATVSKIALRASTRPSHQHGSVAPTDSGNDRPLPRP